MDVSIWIICIYLIKGNNPAMIIDRTMVFFQSSYMIFIHYYMWQMNNFHIFFLSFPLTSISYLCLCCIEWPLGSMGTRGWESRSGWTRKGETSPICFGQAEEKGENAHVYIVCLSWWFECMILGEECCIT